jgi:hypothetical protein
MKIVTLATATVVYSNSRTPTNGELRQPVEGPLIVSDDEAKRLKDNNLLDGEPEDLPDEASEASNEDLGGMTVAELHILVTKEGVPLNDATKKADIIAAIQKHREPAA